MVSVTNFELEQTGKNFQTQPVDEEVVQVNNKVDKFKHPSRMDVPDEFEVAMDLTTAVETIEQLGVSEGLFVSHLFFVEKIILAVMSLKATRALKCYIITWLNNHLSGCI